MVPRWLSRFAGNDHIPAVIRSRNGVQNLKWSSLTIPACEVCNGVFGRLEDRAKSAFEEMKNGYLRAHNLRVVLDYMDKMRVVFWLYQLSICREEHKIRPNFYISDRIGSSDHLCYIFRLENDHSKGIAPIGDDTKTFLRGPSSFGFIVGNIALLSFSQNALLTDHFGMTLPLKNPKDLPVGAIGRTISGTTALRELPNLSRCPGMPIFAFGPNFQIPFIESHVYTAQNEKPRKVRGCEVLEIPKARLSNATVKILLELSVYETQYFLLREFKNMNIPDIERKVTSLCYDELESLIDLQHFLLSHVSLIRYPRKNLLRFF